MAGAYGATTAAGAEQPWKAADALGAPALVATLQGAGPKPAILFVGFHTLYLPGHIPGATYIGPPSQPAGIAALEKWASAQAAKDREVVIYCGCCPLEHCPNVAPAYKTLARLGFTRVRVLILPSNFETDWVNRGYPLDR